MEEDADAAAPVKRAAEEVVGDDEPSAKKPKQEDGPDPAKPAGEGDDDGLDTDDDDDDEPKDDIKRFAARLRPGTLKHTCFVLLQRAGRDGMETNAMLETAEKEGLYVGKNRNVLTTTLSHEPWFVHNPDVKSHWCIRSFLEGPEATEACLAAKPGSEPAGPGRAKGSGKPRKTLTAEEKMAQAAEKAKKATEKAAQSAAPPPPRYRPRSRPRSTRSSPRATTTGSRKPPSSSPRRRPTSPSTRPRSRLPRPRPSPRESPRRTWKSAPRRPTRRAPRLSRQRR